MYIKKTVRNNIGFLSQSVHSESTLGIFGLVVVTEPADVLSITENAVSRSIVTKFRLFFCRSYDYVVLNFQNDIQDPKTLTH